MRHIGTCTLETEHLVLRRFTTGDATAMYRNWASDDEVTKYLTWPTHADVEASVDVLTDWVRSYERTDFYQWAVVPRRNADEPVGSIGAVRVDDCLSIIHIGYCIGRRWWHKGITSEALQSVMDFFLDQVGANRVESRHDPRNPRSGMVMQRCGMRYEGTMRSADRNNQGICDVSWYAMLSSDRHT